MKTCIIATTSSTFVKKITHAHTTNKHKSKQVKGKNHNKITNKCTT
jgi:hypothetical protein